jgi:hypothetical protein
LEILQYKQNKTKQKEEGEESPVLAASEQEN